MSFKQVVQHQLDYTMWATARLVNAAGALTEEELTRDFGTADKSVLGTLVHIFAADRVWYHRVAGLELKPFVEERDYSLKVLRSDWPVLLYDWKLWAAKSDESVFAADVEYVDLKGRPWKNPAWHIVHTVVNHATLHRGQVQGFLRMMGKTPEPLDVIVFCREMQRTALPKAAPSVVRSQE